ncbi:MAG: GNAT family N-acetyltransferase [Gemmatimonadales bacterium]
MPAPPVAVERLRAADLGAAEWDSLAQRGFHLHAWFLAAERCGWEARHVGLRGPSGIRAIVPAYLTGANSLNNLHDRWLGPLSRVLPAAGVSLWPVISVQSPFALVPHPLAAPGKLSPAILHRVFESLETSAEVDGAKAVAWAGVGKDNAALLGVARERGYAIIYSGATARMPVQWDSFEDYLASRSKSVRRTIKADLEAIRAAGLRTSLTTDFRAVVPAMTALYRDAFRRRNGREALVPKEFFEELSRSRSPGIRAQLTWLGDRLVGTSLNLNTDQLLEGTFSAFASEHRAGPAYFNDLVYEPVRVACREGIEAIDLGATALYAKALRGAVLRRRVILIRGTTPSQHRIIRAIGQVVARHTEWKERRALGPLWNRHLSGHMEPGR